MSINIQFTDSQKHDICDKLMVKFEQSGLNLKVFAQTLGLIAADMTNIRHRKWVENQSLIGDHKWLKIADEIDYDPTDDRDWRFVDTYFSKYMTTQFEFARTEARSVIFVDTPGIGKTATAKRYCDTTQNSFLINCSSHYDKNRLIREIGKKVGVGRGHTVEEIFDKSIKVIRYLKNPIFIFDEAGDLHPSAWMVIKRYYNALENRCAFFVMGSDGLRSIINRGIQYEKQGFHEVFSRLGRKYNRAMPTNGTEYLARLREMVKEIAAGNGIADAQGIADIQDKVAANDKELGDLRRVKTEVLKLKKLRA